MANIVIDARMINNTGIGTYIADILKGLWQAKDYSIHCLMQPTDICQGGKNVIECSSKIFSLTEQYEIALKLYKHKADLFHSPQFNIPLGWFGKQVTTIHDCAFDVIKEEIPSQAAYMYYRFMMKAAIRRSRRIITVSESAKKDILNNFEIDPDKITVVHRGIAPKKRCYSDNEILKLRSKYGLQGPFGIYVGLQRPRKNIARILHAIKRIVHDFKIPFKFVIIGKIDTRFVDLREIIADLDLTDYVLLTGRIDHSELEFFYQAAECLVFPSLYEGFGLPVLEAMAYGTPVITSNISSLPEVAGDAAVLVDPYDADQIAFGIKRIVEDHHLVENLREKGYRRIKLFSLDEEIRKTVQVYREVLCEQA